MSLHETFRHQFQNTTGQESPWEEIGGYRLLGFEIEKGEDENLKCLARLRMPDDLDAGGRLYNSSSLESLAKGLQAESKEYLGKIARSLDHRNDVLRLVVAGGMTTLITNMTRFLDSMKESAEKADAILKPYQVDLEKQGQESAARLAVWYATMREP